MRARPSASELIEGFAPESEIEARLTEDPRVLEGLAWGVPRTGHPEGPVGNHVADLLRTIDAWQIPEPPRGDLRVISIVHDALKHRVREWLPHSGPNHHAVRARRLAEGYLADERVLSTIEFHDRPYSLWRRMRRTGRVDEARFSEMLRRVPDHDLLLRFVELDGSTEGKRPEPIDWFRSELAARGALA